MFQIKEKLANNCRNPDEFLQKYDELKTKNARDLDAMVFFMSEVCDKPEVIKITNHFILFY
jgi:hypothetical protein